MTEVVTSMIMTIWERLERSFRDWRCVEVWNCGVVVCGGVGGVVVWWCGWWCGVVGGVGGGVGWVVGCGVVGCGVVGCGVMWWVVWWVMVL